jgi:hypothetical protein
MELKLNQGENIIMRNFSAYGGDFLFGGEENG